MRVETNAPAPSSALSRVLIELINGESDENNEQIFAGRSTVCFSGSSVSNSMWAVQGNSRKEDSHKRHEELDLLVEFS